MQIRNYYIKSPIHYMGNKFKLLPQLFEMFPNDVNIFYDVFGGSGCVTLNINSNRVVYNELNEHIFNLFTMFNNYSADEIISAVEENIVNFQLDNKSGDNYLAFRKYYNESEKNIIDLYTLTCYSFSNLIRFNTDDEFNIGFGNRGFSYSDQLNIKDCCNALKSKKVICYQSDAFRLLTETQFNKDDFIYLDPPYSNTMAVYNEPRAFGGWDIEDDDRLFNILNDLNDKGIRWGLSNVFSNRGHENKHLMGWSAKYNTEHLNRNYHACGRGSSDSDEVYIYNYGLPPKPHKILLW